jgi:hypothetical protein
VRWSVALPAVALAGLLLAGCGPGAAGTGSAGSGPSTAPGTVPPATPPSVVPGDSVPGSPLASPGPSGAAPEVTGSPPAAFLLGAGLGMHGVPGAEGSFTWDGLGSDAPWIVEPDAALRGAGPWSVAFDPALPVQRWTTRWAPVEDGVTGDPAAGSDGAGSSILVQAPGSAGAWSLRVEAWFGAGRHAAWFWTIDVLP